MAEYNYVDRDSIVRGLRMAHDYEGAEFVSMFPASEVVEVKHAHWYGTYYDGYADGCPVYEAFACSACDAEFFVDDSCPSDFKYCPNCGAKMDEEVSE